MLLEYLTAMGFNGRALNHYSKKSLYGEGGKLKKARLETILQRYPWLEPYLKQSCISSEKPNHKDLHFVVLRKIKGNEGFDSARFSLEPVYGVQPIWTFTRWIVLFQVGDEINPRVDWLVGPEEGKKASEWRTVNDVIAQTKEWHSLCLGKEGIPLKFLAVIKNVRQERGIAGPGPAAVTVFLF